MPVFTPYRRVLLCLILSVLLAACASASAASLSLPADTLAIDDYAFSGCTGVTEITLPDGLLSIGAYAFSGCSDLVSVYIPASVQYIGERAFPYTAELLFESGTYAAAWAEENGYNQPPRYYALLVGQEYTGASNTLPGCFRDVDSMRGMLETMDETPYQITVCKDVTASDLLSAVDAAFSQAREIDVCLFYYSGHGCYSASQTYLGALIGTDARYVTMNQLKAALDQSEGDKIVILDSCYSGAAIAAAALTADESAQMDLEAVNAAIISAFAPKTRSALAEDGYYVLTAASAGETSVSGGTTVGGDMIYFGAFTFGLLDGSGYDEAAGAPFSPLRADSNGNGSISLSEGYTYAYAKALVLNSRQHAQCYPSRSNFALWAQRR